VTHLRTLESTIMGQALRVSERRAEQLLAELLEAQGWDNRRPPKGEVLLQQEYRNHPALMEVFLKASKQGPGSGLPEAVVVDRESLVPLMVIEAKAKASDLGLAIREASEVYGAACVAAGYPVLAVGMAGTVEEQYAVRVLKWTGQAWVPVTYEGEPIGWLPGRPDLERAIMPDAPAELRPAIPPPGVLAERADEINRLLRESGIKDEFRPGVLGAIMLALWSTKGNIRQDRAHILSDINEACKAAFWRAGKPELADSLRVDEANQGLAIHARRIVTILERLNITVLTAEHDYLGQLYETFFRYTGGNTIGQYFTPRHAAGMMVDLCEVSAEDIALDIACGTGGFLISVMQRVMVREGLSREQVIEFVRNKLIGYEKEPITAALCVANMILRGDGSTGVRRGDCFTATDFPVGRATVALMNPPFPHKKTDVPPERFVDRALEGLALRGRLAVILPTSLLVKASKEAWRERILKDNTLLAIVQLPDELFQPFASSTTSVVMIERGVTHDPRRKTVFVRLQNDGLALKKGARVPVAGNEIPAAIDAVLNRTVKPGFSGLGSVRGTDEWAVGAYIPSHTPTEAELLQSVDVLLRRLGSFYVRYAREVSEQRSAIAAGELEVVPYRERVGPTRIKNAATLPSAPDTIGGMFDIFYGMKELHSREGIAEGKTLVISPTEAYNGCYGWLDFGPAIQAPFVTVAQTGSIGEAFVQFESCAVNDDCLVLLPKESLGLTAADLVIAAACLHLEKWRFNYGRKLTPPRIAELPVPITPVARQWVARRLDEIQRIVMTAVRDYDVQEVSMVAETEPAYGEPDEEEGITREEFFAALEKVSRPLDDHSDATPDQETTGTLE